MGRALARLMTPKPAYAIDQGLGGVSFSFSPFNDVDSVGRPDRAVQAFTATPVCGLLDCLVHPGTTMKLNYTIANIGTAAAGDNALIHISLVPDEGESNLIIMSSVGQLYPFGTPFVVTNQDFVIPADIPPGHYTIQLDVAGGFFPEIPGTDADNHASVSVTVVASVPPIG
jgi:hypothetical protein